MEISPLDIRNQSFKKKSFGGFDPEEVQAFLEQVAREMENLNHHSVELNEKLKVAEERVNYYKLIEKTLQDSVVTMQKTVDEAKANAEKEGELIIAEAKAQAVRESERIRNEASELRSEVQSLRTQRTNYFIRIRSVIRAQEELLKAMEEQDDMVSSSSEADRQAMMFRKNQAAQSSQTSQNAPASRPAPATRPTSRPQSAPTNPAPRANAPQQPHG
jgi:cell division initiation protein